MVCGDQRRSAQMDLICAVGGRWGSRSSFAAAVIISLLDKVWKNCKSIHVY
jgi:hypothetical protein